MGCSKYLVRLLAKYSLRFMEETNIVERKTVLRHSNNHNLCLRIPIQFTHIISSLSTVTSHRQSESTVVD